MAKDTEDKRSLNQQAEDAIIAAQWEQARRLGLTDLHKDSINSSGQTAPNRDTE